MTKSIWILFKTFWSVLKSPFRFILESLKAIWVRIGTFFLEHTYFLRKKFAWIGKKFDDFSSIFLGKQGFFVKLFFVFQSVVSLLSALISAVLILSTFNQIFNLGKSVINPRGYFMNLLAEQLDNLPSWSSLFSAVDADLCSSTSSVFRPCLTLSGFWAKCGISYFLNQTLQALLQAVAFSISIFLLRWSMSRLRTNFRKGV